MTRRSEIDYFEKEKNAPAPLTAIVRRRVRFEEVDPLGIVWHGRYSSYFEDGRDAFGRKFHLKYYDMHDNGFIAPLIKFHADYHLPLEYQDEFLIYCSLSWSDAAKLNFSFKIEKMDKSIAATGYTVQIFTDLNRKLLILRPDFVNNLYNNWEELLKI